MQTARPYLVEMWNVMFSEIISEFFLLLLISGIMCICVLYAACQTHKSIVTLY